MYFINLTTIRALDGSEKYEVMWGVGNKVEERTDDISSFLDATDVAQHFLHMLFERNCSAVKVEYTDCGPGVKEDSTDSWVVKNKRMSR